MAMNNESPFDAMLRMMSGYEGRTNPDPDVPDAQQMMREMDPLFDVLGGLIERFERLGFEPDKARRMAWEIVKSGMDE